MMTWCSLCSCPLQRSRDGLLFDGVMLHLELVHRMSTDQPGTRKLAAQLVGKAVPSP